MQLQGCDCEVKEKRMREMYEIKGEADMHLRRKKDTGRKRRERKYNRNPTQHVQK